MILYYRIWSEICHVTFYNQIGAMWLEEEREEEVP